jgi:hypothetical protein
MAMHAENYTPFSSPYSTKYKSAVSIGKTILYPLFSMKFLIASLPIFATSPPVHSIEKACSNNASMQFFYNFYK